MYYRHLFLLSVTNTATDTILMTVTIVLVLIPLLLLLFNTVLVQILVPFVELLAEGIVVGGHFLTTPKGPWSETRAMISVSG